MSSLAQFGGGARPPKNIVNRCSAGGVSMSTISAVAANQNARSVASGALTATTLATVLSVTGAGSIDFLAAWCADATARTIRLKVTIDGTSVFDATSSSIAVANDGIFAIGGGSSTSFTTQPVSFNTSLLIQVASSLTETDKINIGYRYITY